jgi:hypothetical protein
VTANVQLGYVRAPVAQGIEHRSPKAGAAGSNPAGGAQVQVTALPKSLLQGRYTFYPPLWVGLSRSRAAAAAAPLTCRDM